MIVEPYVFSFPFQNVTFEIGPMRESNCVSIAESARDNRQSPLFSAKRGRKIRNEELLLQPCNAKDLTIGSKSRTQLSTLARCADVACPADLRAICGGIAIRQRFQFLSATNSLGFRFCGAGKGTLGIDPPSGLLLDARQVCSRPPHPASESAGYSLRFNVILAAENISPRWESLRRRCGEVR